MVIFFILQYFFFQVDLVDFIKFFIVEGFLGYGQCFVEVFECDVFVIEVEDEVDDFWFFVKVDEGFVEVLEECFINVEGDVFFKECENFGFFGEFFDFFGWEWFVNGEFCSVDFEVFFF